MESRIVVTHFTQIGERIFRGDGFNMRLNSG